MGVRGTTSKPPITIDNTLARYVFEDLLVFSSLKYHYEPHFRKCLETKDFVRHAIRVV